MSTKDLQAMAREAGKAGRAWGEWTASDEVQAAIDAAPVYPDTDALEAAFCEGRRELRAKTWRVTWTTAPVDYDTAGTEALEACGDWYGKKLRRVAIEPGHYVYQTSRYWSGLHSSWDDDPRVAEATAKARLDTERADREAREAKRAAGLEWLKTATEDELEDFDTFEARGVRYDDVRAEKTRREADTGERARVAEWARCTAAIPEGATLVDEGTQGMRGVYGGWIAGHPSRVYHSVRIVRGWPDEADRANVVGEGNENAGSASLVAGYIASGRFRIAAPSEAIPPHAVIDRIGKERPWKEIRRVEVDGRVVWVARRLWASAPMVLDDRGHIVRAKRLVEAALAVAS